MFNKTQLVHKSLTKTPLIILINKNCTSTFLNVNKLNYCQHDFSGAELKTF